MLTSLTVRNFKRFDEVTIELGNPVVFVGPNNSGKTTALQALALWDIGLRRWLEKRGPGPAPEKRPGVTINRRDLVGVPVPSSLLLWRELHVRETQRSNGKSETRNLRIDVAVEGVTGAEAWACGLEFDYANEESFYCRPLRASEIRQPERMAIPEAAAKQRITFLPPMSGLAGAERRLDRGAINVLLGQGITAEVLRNLCYQISESTVRTDWDKLVERIERLFGVQLERPVYVAERGEITMSYRERSGLQLDLSASGRGLQQTLLLLAHLTLNRDSVLLIDEPDAHLEILRQRQTYQLLGDVAAESNSQVIMASHSEVVLNEAADRDVVIAFLGRPKRIDDRGSQVLKSLKEIGFEDYYQAEQTGWVLYLEGSTDLAILKALADRLEHPASRALERPFVGYVGNLPKKAQDHFFGLLAAAPELRGLALFDRLDRELPEHPPLVQRSWRRAEIESYLCTRSTLLRYARQVGEDLGGGPLFAAAWQDVMTRCMRELEAALDTLGKPSPWSADLKVTDEFLDPLFSRFYAELKLPNLMRKTDYHRLAEHIPLEEIDPEIVEVLGSIYRASGRTEG